MRVGREEQGRTPCVDDVTRICAWGEKVTTGWPRRLRAEGAFDTTLMLWYAVFGSEHPSNAEKERGMRHWCSDDHCGASPDDPVTHVHIIDVGQNDYGYASRLRASADSATELQRLQHRFPQVHDHDIRGRCVRFMNRGLGSLRGDHVVP
jgi:hypothetical protein